ncbi:glycosyltransferase [Alcaligenes faecalis]|jgi:glycosyltransferase involved in cell wall biosynthesis|uniref:Glycosyltransferase n=1 Tax=Alcaligenes faecalis TaxID=511 RepID=A0ABY7N4Y0_ALCFA|nr:glycosyltransferase [Alcaligenes faecalis]WBM39179.1 glycosyltransferase [Alcaligenes faecalis]
MIFYPVFLSLVCVVRNQAEQLEPMLTQISEKLSPLVSDYELIVVDNASTDNSISRLQALASEQGLPNLQVYALTKEVDTDTASWVGLENALGDFVAVFNPAVDDLDFLPEMLAHAVSGSDVVFALNQQPYPRTLAYRLAFATFNILYKRLSGIDLANEAPPYRVLSKRVVNFILQHPQPAITYRHLPATGGFAKTTLHYRSALPETAKPRRLGHSVDRGMRLLVSTTRAPMRLVTTLSLFGAVANLLYSLYVLFIAFYKDNIAEGWISLSLQQSGMFFLISLVLLVLGEYILNMASLSNEGPLYHIAQEFTSARISRREKLNIQEQESSTARSNRLS